MHDPFQPSQVETYSSKPYAPLCLYLLSISLIVSDATDVAVTSDLPKYSGIYIGLGVCMCLFLLSGGAVCILNLTNNGGFARCCSTLCWSIRKEDKSSNGMSRLAANRQSIRNGANIKMLPIQRMARSNSDANA